MAGHIFRRILSGGVPVLKNYCCRLTTPGKTKGMSLLNPAILYRRTFNQNFLGGKSAAIPCPMKERFETLMDNMPNGLIPGMGASVERRNSHRVIIYLIF